MVEIKRKPRETISAFIRRFSSKVRMSGVLKEARKRQFYISSLNKKKRKEKALRKAEKKRERSLSQ